MKRLFMMLVIGMFCISLASADSVYTFEQDSPFEIEISMANANLSSCDTCTCTMSIFYPNGSAMVKNVAGNSSNGYCSYVNTSNTLGSHDGEMIFTNGVDYGRTTFGMDITKTGTPLTQAKSSISWMAIMLLLFLFLLTLFGISKLPNGNARDEEGMLLSINNLKYFRAVLIAFAWGLLIAVMFVSSGVFYINLEDNSLGDIFFNIYKFMMILTYPMILIWFIWVFYMFVEDRKINEYLRMGVMPGGDW